MQESKIQMPKKIKNVIIAIVALIATIAILFILKSEAVITAQAEIKEFEYIPNGEEVGNAVDTTFIASNIEGDIKIYGQVEKYTISDTGNVVLKTIAGECNKLRIETPQNAIDIEITVEVSLNKEGIDKYADIITSDGLSIVERGKVNIDETGLTSGFCVIKGKAQNGGEYYLWSNIRIYIKSVKVSYKYKENITNNLSYMESVELQEAGKLPEVVKEKAQENRVYRFIGWVNEENEAVDCNEIVPKGKYKTVYVSIETRGAKVLISKPTSICFGYKVRMLNEGITKEVLDKGGIKFEGIFRPENTNKVSRWNIEKCEINNNVIEIEMAIYNIPKEYYRTGIEADLAVYFNGGIVVETSEKCRKSIGEVAECALKQLREEIDEEYKYEIYVNGELKYSKYTVTQRNILSELSGVWL